MGREGLTAVAVYFVLVIGIGIWFFLKNLKHGGGEKDYFLGGREMGAWVSALSAGASDMSAWVLMGLPGAICCFGMGQIWIAIGLFAGTAAAWIIVAPALRRFSILARDAITIPQFLTNRFLTKDRTLQTIAAVVFMTVYCVYTASSIYACGVVFNTITGMNPPKAMFLAGIVIVFYTFLGGFSAVCWTDFFQGLLMLGALMLAPILAFCIMQGGSFTAPDPALPPNYYSLLSGGGADFKSFTDIINGFGWGLGYFGMPHILIRFFAIRSEREMRKSQIIGCSWIFVILAMAGVVGILGRNYLGKPADESAGQMVFIDMVKNVFTWLGNQTGLMEIMLFLAGLLLSAILAASMSTADSQLLASSSAFASDMYKPLLRSKASDREMMWGGRIIVLVTAAAACMIAASPNCRGIMSLVSCAWAAFGAAFGPVILLALYWKRMTYRGAVAGMTAGFLTDAVWYAAKTYLAHPPVWLQIYEIIPGFFCGAAAAVLVSLLDKAPPPEVAALFDRATLRWIKKRRN